MVKIEKIRKKGRNYLATLTGGNVEKLAELAVFDHALSDGKEFDDERWAAIKEESDFYFAYDSAMRMLSARAHSEGDLAKKLRSRKFDKRTIDKVLEECRRVNLIDDARFAEEYVRELRTGGAGSTLIKMKLRAKGISEGLTESVLDAETSPNPDLEAARIALAKKSKSLEREADPNKKREKAYRHLASKGFSYDIISQLFEDSDISLWENK